MWDLSTLNRINQVAAKLGRHPEFPVRDPIELATQDVKNLEKLEKADEEKNEK